MFEPPATQGMQCHIRAPRQETNKEEEAGKAEERFKVCICTTLVPHFSRGVYHHTLVEVCTTPFGKDHLHACMTKWSKGTVPHSVECTTKLFSVPQILC